MVFYFAEVQKLWSLRKADEIEADTLADAQRIAEKEKFFCDTVLVIGDEVDERGFILDPICYYDKKQKNARWHYC